jgi:biopolymer transport protein TolR
MRKKSLEAPFSEINLVPYIDVMLVLLVIFMITTPMLTQGVTVDLPKAVSESIQSSGKEPIIVSVNQAGEYFLNISDRPAAAIDEHSLRVRVAAELQLAQQSSEPRAVLVKGDQGVAYGKVVSAMSLLKQAGATQVGLLTESPQEKSA